MRIVRTPSEFPANTSIRTGFVPTMGALHEGHLSLIRRSKSENDRTVVSIFVNPTQFGKGEDFDRYPRPFEKDCELAVLAGADIVFAPNSDEMYKNHASTIHIPYVTELFEGKVRPGHFDGVATIVAKLFNIVTPNHAYFGEKDLQQCAVVKKLIDDFNIGTRLIICDTVREEDGLAMSSRNAFLSPDHRNLAPLIYRYLIEAREKILQGNPFPSIRQNYIEMLEQNAFKVNYFELVDRTTMHPISEPNDYASLIAAAKIGTTRLIDNVRVIG